MTTKRSIATAFASTLLATTAFATDGGNATAYTGGSVNGNASTSNNAITINQTANTGANANRVKPVETVVIGSCDGPAWSALFRQVTYDKLMGRIPLINVTSITDSEILTEEYQAPASQSTRKLLADAAMMSVRKPQPAVTTTSPPPNTAQSYNQSSNATASATATGGVGGNATGTTTVNSVVTSPVPTVVRFVCH